MSAWNCLSRHVEHNPYFERRAPIDLARPNPSFTPAPVTVDFMPAFTAASSATIAVFAAWAGDVPWPCEFQQFIDHREQPDRLDMPLVAENWTLQNYAGAIYGRIVFPEV
jgi:hypothetical protein